MPVQLEPAFILVAVVTFFVLVPALMSHLGHRLTPTTDNPDWVNAFDDIAKRIGPLDSQEEINKGDQ